MSEDKKAGAPSAKAKKESATKVAPKKTQPRELAGIRYTGQAKRVVYDNRELMQGDLLTIGKDITASSCESLLTGRFSNVFVSVFTDEV